MVVLTRATPVAYCLLLPNPNPSPNPNLNPYQGDGCAAADPPPGGKWVRVSVKVSQPYPSNPYPSNPIPPTLPLQPYPSNPMYPSNPPNPNANQVGSGPSTLSAIAARCRRSAGSRKRWARWAAPAARDA